MLRGLGASVTGQKLEVLEKQPLLGEVNHQVGHAVRGLGLHGQAEGRGHGHPGGEISPVRPPREIHWTTRTCAELPTLPSMHSTRLPDTFPQTMVINQEENHNKSTQTMPTTRLHEETSSK